MYSRMYILVYVRHLYWSCTNTSWSDDQITDVCVMKILTVSTYSFLPVYQYDFMDSLNILNVGKWYHNDNLIENEYGMSI